MNYSFSSNTLSFRPYYSNDCSCFQTSPNCWLQNLLLITCRFSSYSHFFYNPTENLTELIGIFKCFLCVIRDFSIEKIIKQNTLVIIDIWLIIVNWRKLAYVHTNEYDKWFRHLRFIKRLKCIFYACRAVHVYQKSLSSSSTLQFSSEHLHA